MTDDILSHPPGDHPPVTTFHGDTFPAACCEHCASRRRESLALRARANLLREAVNGREPFGVVCHHAIELLDMMAARGLA